MKRILIAAALFGFGMYGMIFGTLCGFKRFDYDNELYADPIGCAAAREPVMWLSLPGWWCNMDFFPALVLTLGFGVCMFASVRRPLIALLWFTPVVLVGNLLMNIQLTPCQGYSFEYWRDVSAPTDVITLSIFALSVVGYRKYKHIKEARNQANANDP